MAIASHQRAALVLFVPPLAALLSIPAALAGTIPDTLWTASGLRVCSAANTQEGAALAASPIGGIFVAWEDSRADPLVSDLYMTHVLGNGQSPPGWPVNGAACSLAPGNQSTPRVVADPAGGAYVTWEDYRTGTTPKMYAQHLDATGAVVSGWPADGLALCSRSGAQRAARAVSDGADGLLVVWEDYRMPQSRIVAQRVLAGGTFAPGWSDTGFVVAPATGGQVNPVAESDGAGGMFIAWNDGRGSVTTSIDVYAQRIRGDATPATGWPISGIAVCAATGAQDRPRIANDGTGGILVTWSDPRAGAYIVYEQRITGAGAIASGWPVNGIAVCTDAAGQLDPVIASDGAGRAFIAWSDLRGGAGNAEVYMQRVDTDGSSTLDPGGFAICTAPGDQLTPRIVADGFGGAILGWQDSRFAPEVRLFAQHVDPLGALVAGWPVNGRLIADTNFVLEPAAIVASGDGGAYFAWSGAAPPVDPQDPDLYAARVAGNSLVPATASLVSVHASPAAVTLRWWTPGTATRIAIERSTPGQGWEAVDAVFPDASGLIDWVDRAVTPGARYGYRLASADGVAGETWVTVPAALLSLRPLAADPAGDRARFAYSLPAMEPARLEVFDAAGRRRSTRDLAPATFDGVIDLDVSALEPGVYALRLRQGAGAVAAKLVVAR